MPDQTLLRSAAPLLGTGANHLDVCTASCSVALNRQVSHAHANKMTDLPWRLGALLRVHSVTKLQDVCKETRCVPHVLLSGGGTEGTIIQECKKPDTSAIREYNAA